MHVTSFKQINIERLYCLLLLLAFSSTLQQLKKIRFIRSPRARCGEEVEEHVEIGILFFISLRRNNWITLVLFHYSAKNVDCKVECISRTANIINANSTPFSPLG